MAYLMQTVIATALAEVGYLEKASNRDLDSKTGNAGRANYTKYGRDLVNWLGDSTGDTFGINYQWCQQFVEWCFIQAYGLAGALQLLRGWTAYTPAGASYFKSTGQWHTSDPRQGDVIYFQGTVDGTFRICHVGLVYSVEGRRVFTVEGNTSGGSSVIPNGGAVCMKSYDISNSRIAGYGRPAYTEVIRKPNLYNVRQGQTMLNAAFRAVVAAACGGPLEVDGTYGQMTRDACLAAWKYVANHGYGADLTVSNHNFGDACREAAQKMQISLGAQNQLVYIAQTILSGRGYYDGDMDAQAGPVFDAATRAFQAEYGLTVDGVIGPDTWGRLFGD